MLNAWPSCPALQEEVAEKSPHPCRHLQIGNVAMPFPESSDRWAPFDQLLQDMQAHDRFVIVLVRSRLVANALKSSSIKHRAFHVLCCQGERDWGRGASLYARLDRQGNSGSSWPADCTAWTREINACGSQTVRFVKYVSPKGKPRLQDRAELCGSPVESVVQVIPVVGRGPAAG